MSLPYILFVGWITFIKDGGEERLKNRLYNLKKLSKMMALLALLIVVTSCSSVRVSSDYDRKANFETLKTFAFFKTGIDKAEISDLDKRRILRAIEAEL